MSHSGPGTGKRGLPVSFEVNPLANLQAHEGLCPWSERSLKPALETANLHGQPALGYLP